VSLEVELGGLLDLVSAESAAAGAGTVATAATAMAAGLVAMTARRSKPMWNDAGAAAGQAEVLRSRAAALLPESGSVYEAAVAQLAEAREHQGAASDRRDWKLAQALRSAAQAPLRCAEIAADVAELAGEVVARCDAASRPDAIAAGRLAEAATLIGAHLVEVNLVAGVDDELRAQTAVAVARARRGCERAVSAEVDQARP
jgi:formiminotetrahydrofolate cyclodeaminase